MIAEIKRRSPSKGDLNVGLDPAQVGHDVRRRRRGVPVGADRRGVLRRLGRRPAGGPLGDRRPGAAQGLHGRPRATSSTPGIMGADAVLLIAAALDRLELVELHHLAVDLGLDVLVEVHDEPELEVALECRGHADRRQPARPRDVRGRPRRGPSGWRRPSRPASSRSPSRACATPPTPAPGRRRLRRHPRRRDPGHGRRPRRRLLARSLTPDRVADVRDGLPHSVGSRHSDQNHVRTGRSGRVPYAAACS